MSDQINIIREAVAWARMTLDADFIEMGETTTYNNDTITEVIRKLNIALSRMSALSAALDTAEAEKARAVEAHDRINDKAIMNAGEFARYVREEIAALRTGSKP